MKVQRLEQADVELSALVRSGESTVLFVHGLAGRGGEWVDVVDHLDHSIGVIAPDQRAHGMSFTNRDVAVGRGDYVADLVAMINAFGSGPVAVVGQSMGGIVATLLAAARPDLVRSLVLVECGMEALQSGQLEDVDRWLRSWPAAFANKDEARGFFGIDAMSSKAWIDGLETTGDVLVARFDRLQMLDTMVSLARRDRWAEWASLKAPCTLIRASTSLISDEDVERMIRVRPDAELVVVESSGHDVHLDQPKAIAAILSCGLMNSKNLVGDAIELGRTGSFSNPANNR